MRFGWTPREVGALRMSEFWTYLEQLDDLAKQESGKKNEKRVDSLDGTFLRPIGR